MKKSCLAILSGLAFGGAVIVNAPHAWSQTSPGSSSSEKSGSESRMQKPTDPPQSVSPQPGGSSQSGTSSQSGMSRSEGTGLQSGSESRTASSQKWPKEKVKAAQEALKSKGFDPGPADGIVGPRTGQALREFQKSQNLQVTGRFDDKTASALGVDTAGSMSSSPSSSSSSKESTIGSRGTSSEPSGKSPSGSSGTSGQPSSSLEKEKTGNQAGSEPAKSGARGGTTTSPPSKPTGRE